jgi:hypothetical protein
MLERLIVIPNLLERSSSWYSVERSRDEVKDAEAEDAEISITECPSDVRKSTDSVRMVVVDGTRPSAELQPLPYPWARSMPCTCMEGCMQGFVGQKVWETSV